MAEPSEVRAWARGQGLEVSARGAIPADLAAQYEAAHAGNGSGEYPAPEADVDAGVTEADFPPMPAPEIDAGTTDPQPRRPRERKPRVVKGPSRPGRKNWRQAFGGGGTKPKARGPRTDLSEFAEDVWGDLALLASGVMPPVGRVLGIQAPYAGVVFDEAVRGLPLVDGLLQPIARASVSLRALNGLLGPVVFTTGLCVQGQWAENEDGTTAYGPDGRPIPTPRTAMMLGGLKYSLLQMSRTADLSKVQERAEVNAERMRSVDMLVDFIMGYPPANAPAPAPGGHPDPSGPRSPSAGAPGQVLVPTFVYPPPPQMDETGART